MFISFISCGDGYTIANAELTTGCFQSGDDIVKITDNTLQFNDGVVMEIKRSNDSYSYFINGYFSGNELLATQIEYNPESKRYRWTRFESGINTQYYTRVSCP